MAAITLLTFPSSGSVDFNSGDIDYFVGADPVEATVDNRPLRNLAFRDNELRDKSNELVDANNNAFGGAALIASSQAGHNTPLADLENMLATSINADGTIQTTALTAHFDLGVLIHTTSIDASNSDHDGRYRTESEMSDTGVGTSGASLVGVDATLLSNSASTTVQGVLEDYDGLIENNEFEVFTVREPDSPLVSADFNTTNELSSIDFDDAVEEGIAYQFVVPENYVAGRQIFLGIRHFENATSGTAKFEVSSDLYRPNTDVVGTPAGTLVSLRDIVAAAPSNRLDGLDRTIGITDATGQINSIAVSAMDVIVVQVKRDATDAGDTMTGDLRITNFLVQL